MHQNIFAPQVRSYGIVALPGKYPNEKREGYIIAAKYNRNPTQIGQENDKDGEQ